MRSFRVSVVVGVISLALLAAAASPVNAQRMPLAPTAPHPAMLRPNNIRNNTFVPGILPSATVQPVTSFPFDRRTHTFSAVPLTTTARIPTYASTFPTYGPAYNAFLNAGRLTSFYETY